MPKSALPCVEFGTSVFHVPPACLCSWALRVNLGLTLVVSTALWLFFLMFLSIRQELPCSSLPTLFGLLAHAERHSAGILMAHAIDFSVLLLTVQVVFVHCIDQVNYKSLLIAKGTVWYCLKMWCCLSQGWKLISKIHEASLPNGYRPGVLSLATLPQYYQVPPWICKERVHPSI